MSSEPSIVGRPYQADHNYSDNDPATLTLVKGGRGKVIEARPDTGWVRVTKARTGEEGWVPRVYITINMRPLKVIHNTEPLLLASSGIPRNLLPHAGHVLFDSLDALMIALRLHRGMLTFIDPKWLGILSDDQRCSQLMSAIKSGMVGSFIDIVHNPNSTIHHFRDIMTPVQLGNHNAGIYFRVTEDFAGASTRQPEAYVGQTLDFARRMAEHTRPPNIGEVSARVRSQRYAGRINVYEICRLPPGNTELMIYAEQFLILVMQSYLREIKTLNIPTAETIDAETALLTEFDNKIAGAVLSNLANQVFRETGLSGMVDRPTFGCNDGLNYQSPLTEYTLHEKKLWIRTIQPNVKVAFHRSGVKMKQKTPTSVYAQVLRSPPSTGQSLHLDAGIYAGEDGPRPGTTVFPVVEIMINGEEHHTPWARLGPLGIWRDWKRANSLGLRIEWEDQGRKYQRYCQAAQVWKWTGRTPGSMLTYTVATALINFFNQMTSITPRDWEADFGLPRMKELRMDFQNNELRLENVPRSEASYARPPMRSYAEMATEMEGVGLRNVNGPWQRFTGETVNFKRRICDTCYVRSKFVNGVRREAGGVMCVQRADENGVLVNNCANCWVTGRPCSWTSDRAFDADPRLVAYLEVLPLAPVQITEIQSQAYVFD